MDCPSSEPVIHVCVLAAGTSTRFGATKLTQTLHGLPLLQHALIAATGACPGQVTLVAGHDQQAVIAAADDLADQIVINDDFRSGIGSSIAAGVRVCRENADAIVILLADQPLITATHLNMLIERWSCGNAEIVASHFDGTIGPPILFSTGTYDVLCELTGDKGAKSVLRSRDYDVTSVDIPEAGIDVDSPETLRELDRR